MVSSCVTDESGWCRLRRNELESVTHVLFNLVLSASQQLIFIIPIAIAYEKVECSGLRVDG